MAENSNKTGCGSVGSIGFSGALTIVFIVLKLLGVISWSWLWVLSPLWISTILGIALFVIAIILYWIVDRM
jgi:glucan phosphoethanolaminetransferase (alkaline phosphatase superfamily)